MRPTGAKSHLAGIEKTLVHGVLLEKIAIFDILLNAHIDRPTAIGREVEVFPNGTVMFFPAIKTAVTEVTCGIIRSRRRRIVEEACPGKLISMSD